MLWQSKNIMLNFNTLWKKLITIQSIGYLLAILMSPVLIRIIIDEHIGGTSFITFPIISFIVWILFIVLPVVCAYIKRIKHKDVCFMVLWIPPTMVFAICLISLLINIISLLW